MKKNKPSSLIIVELVFVLIITILISLPTHAVQARSYTMGQYLYNEPVSRALLGGEWLANPVLISPHTTVGADEAPQVIMTPADRHEIVDLRADLTALQSTVNQVTTQQLNNNSSFNPSTNNDAYRIDALEAKINDLTTQLNTLRASMLGSTGVSASAGLSSNNVSYEDMQALTKRMTNVEGTLSANDSMLKRILSFLKLK